MTLPDASLVQRAAAAAAGGQRYPAGALYVLATPIGNLADVSLRAVHVLSLVDAVACEDTRHSAVLLRHLGLDKPLLALHRHNEREAAGTVVQRLARGERIAYVSDAGTPAVSDPGAVLVASALAAGQRVIPVPGASSVLAALSAAGDASEGPFVFIGFLAARGLERSEALRQMAAERRTQVVLEAPHRIDALAASLGAACGGRLVTVCRELTKQYETVVRLGADGLSAWLAEDAQRNRGEFALVLHALAPAADAAPESLTAASLKVLETLLAALPLKQAVALAAEATGAPRNLLYARALQLKSAAPGS